MTNKEAIIKADAIRPNDLPDSMKAEWLMELEGRYAEIMGEDIPENEFPSEQTLLMPYPHDNSYVSYLMAKIDIALQEGALYQNDMILANSEINSAMAWYRRNNNPNDTRRILI